MWKSFPGLLSSFRRLGQGPRFAYAALLALQLKVVWGMWHWRDLTLGDEAGYYNLGWLWHARGQVDIVWSPLYTMFLGAFLRLSEDAYVVVVLHRVALVLAIAVLVLHLMRRLLPAGLAWWAAAWSALLPSYFDTAFTVHLFAALPALLSWILLLHWRSPWARGIVLALYLTAALLLRNEYAAAAGVLAGGWLAFEIVGGRARRPRPASLLAAYALPLAAVILVVGAVYARSVVRFPVLAVTAERRHTLNMCQAYAFAYKQRHPEWDRNPWASCGEVMQLKFGKELPTLGEMLRANPAAVWEHVRWNFGLLPGGLELLLFGSTHAKFNPDYNPDIPLGRRGPEWLGLLLAGILLTGGFSLLRDRRFWWRAWLKPRAQAWVAMMAVLIVALPVVATQRPRPAYLLAQGLVLIAITATCAFALARRLCPRASRRRRPTGQAFLPLAMVLMVGAIPRFYPKAYAPGSRPLLSLYERLRPFAEDFRRRGAHFLVTAHAMELNGYLGHDYFRDPAEDFDYTALPADPSMPLVEFLERWRIRLLYVDAALWQRLQSQPRDRALVTAPQSVGWEIRGMGRSGDDPWMLLRRAPDETAPLSDSAPPAPAPPPAPGALGRFTDAPAAVSPEGERVDLFVRGPRDRVFWRMLDDGSWGDWLDLGGLVTSSPAAARDPDGRLDLFARSIDEQVWMRKGSGQSWSRWSPLSGQITEGLAVVVTEGRIELFARGKDAQIWQRSWRDGQWEPVWSPLGGVASSAPSVASSRPGALTVFVRGPASHLWAKWRKEGQWGEWADLGGTLSAAPAATGRDGRLDAFIRDEDGRTWCRSWERTSWGPWEDLEGAAGSGPAAATTASGRVYLFALGTDRQVWHRIRDGRQWLPWRQLDGIGY